MTQRNAIVYTRISYDPADETGVVQGKGVADQEKDARGLAARLGWTVVRVVEENDTSAFKRKKITLPDGTRALRVVRPGFRSVLDDLANGRANALIALDLDRAMRDPRDLEDLIDVVEGRQIPVESVTGSLRLANDAEITMARVMVAIANKASRDTSRRVARAHRRVAEEGRPIGGKRMYGFERNGIDIRPDEAEEILHASQRLLEGVSVREIAQDLRRRGVPTVEGRPWTSASLRCILRRPRNAGLVVHRGERLPVKAQWQPIVPLEVYEAVARVLSDPNRMTSPGNTPLWLGSGLYRCACGGPMRVQGRERYRCQLVATGHTKGTGHSTIPARAVDDVVESVVLARLALPDMLAAFVEPTAEVDVGQLQSEATALRLRLATLAEDYADGHLSRVQLVAGTKRIEARLSSVEAELSRAGGRSPLTPLLGARDVAAAWAQMPLSSRRAIIRAFVEVRIARATLGRRFDPERVEITWRR